ncbi:MAG TPA: hypothetical protein DEG96_01930 [Candidatus Atribacteria bacterium]|nr:hypothetical protein [Candidatus Atribacteria bacterium]
MSSKVLNFKKITKIFSKISVVLFIILIVVLYSYGNNEDYNQRIKQEQERLKQIEDQIERVKNEINNLQKEESGYLDAINKIEKLLLETEKELKTIEKDIELTLKELNKIEDEFILAKEKLKEKTKILEVKLRETYKHNRAGYLAILLSSETFSEFITRYRYFKDILSQDNKVIGDILQQIKRTEDKKIDLENREEILRLLKEEVEKEKENIEFSIKAKKSIIKKINSQKNAYLKSLEELEQSSSEIKNIIERIYHEQEKTLKEKEKQSPGITLTPKKGIFTLPVQGKLISNFGRQMNLDFNTYTFNSGIDVSAPLGEVVRSAGSGEVIYTGNIKGYGQIIIIDHGGRTTTLYAHLSKILVEIGDKVNKGQIIGQVGESGGVSSPRLHFEVRVEGKPTDPMNWL